MTDLRDYSDQELSMWVFNDELLYHYRNNEKVLFGLIDNLFFYTDDQKDQLLKDLESID